MPEGPKTENRKFALPIPRNEGPNSENPIPTCVVKMGERETTPSGTNTTLLYDTYASDTYGSARSAERGARRQN